MKHWCVSKRAVHVVLHVLMEGVFASLVLSPPPVGLHMHMLKRQAYDVFNFKVRCALKQGH